MNVVFRIPVIIIIIHIRKLRSFFLIPRQGPCHREVGCETLERLWFVAGNFSRRDKGGSAGYYRFIEHNINHTIITIIIINLIKTSITFCSYHSALLDSPLLCVPELGLSTEKHSMTIMTTVVNFNHHRDDDDEANLNLSMKIPEQPSQVCCSPRSQPSVSISLQPSEPKKKLKMTKMILSSERVSHNSRFLFFSVVFES